MLGQEACWSERSSFMSSYGTSGMSEVTEIKQEETDPASSCDESDDSEGVDEEPGENIASTTRVNATLRRVSPSAITIKNEPLFFSSAALQNTEDPLGDSAFEPTKWCVAVVPKIEHCGTSSPHADIYAFDKPIKDCLVESASAGPVPAAVSPPVTPSSITIKEEPLFFLSPASQNTEDPLEDIAFEPIDCGGVAVLPKTECSATLPPCADINVVDVPMEDPLELPSLQIESMTLPTMAECIITPSVVIQKNQILSVGFCKMTTIKTGNDSDDCTIANKTSLPSGHVSSSKPYEASKTSLVRDNGASLETSGTKQRISVDFEGDWNKFLATVPPPRCPTTWKVGASTSRERARFHLQECLRFENHRHAFTYRHHGYESAVGPVKLSYVATSGPNGRLISVTDERYLIFFALVRDAVGRLPNGVGTLRDVTELIADSQYLDMSLIQGPGLLSKVAGSLAVLSWEDKPCLRYNAKHDMCIYLHRAKTEEELECVTKYVYKQQPSTPGERTAVSLKMRSFLRVNGMNKIALPPPGPNRLSTCPSKRNADTTARPVCAKQIKLSPSSENLQQDCVNSEGLRQTCDPPNGSAVGAAPACGKQLNETVLVNGSLSSSSTLAKGMVSSLLSTLAKREVSSSSSNLAKEKGYSSLSTLAKGVLSSSSVSSSSSSVAESATRVQEQQKTESKIVEQALPNDVLSQKDSSVCVLKQSSIAGRSTSQDGAKTDLNREKNKGTSELVSAASKTGPAATSAPAWSPCPNADPVLLVCRPNGGSVKNIIPHFLVKLWNLVVRTSTDEVICWGSGGSSFLILDRRRFGGEILPVHFKGLSMCMFIEVLNSYGFQAILNVNIEADSEVLEFSHKCFVKGNPRFLEHIKKKTKSIAGRTTPQDARMEFSSEESRSPVTGFTAVHKRSPQLTNMTAEKTCKCASDDAESGSFICPSCGLFPSTKPNISASRIEGRSTSPVVARTELNNEKSCDDLTARAASRVAEKMSRRNSCESPHGSPDHGTLQSLTSDPVLVSEPSARKLRTIVPPFVTKLWNMVSDRKTNDSIRWGLDGSSFVIRGVKGFLDKSLPLYFQERSMLYFCRELYSYGFTEILKDEAADSDTLEFAHTFFVKDKPHLLEHIKKKTEAEVILAVDSKEDKLAENGAARNNRTEDNGRQECASENKLLKHHPKKDDAATGEAETCVSMAVFSEPWSALRASCLFRASSPLAHKGICGSCYEQLKVSRTTNKRKKGRADCTSRRRRNVGKPCPMCDEAEGVERVVVEYISLMWALKCGHCGWRCTKKQYMDAHVQACAQCFVGPQHQCQLCVGAQFDSALFNLLVFCYTCSQPFMAVFNLQVNAHERRLSSYVREILCADCGLQLKDKKALNKHMREHGGCNHTSYKKWLMSH